MKLLFITFLVFGAFGQAVTRDQKQVLGVIDRLVEAGIKRDVAAIDRLYSPTFFHTNPNGSVMNKKQVLAIYRAPAAVQVDSNIHDEDRVMILGNMGMVNTRTVLKGTVDGKPFETKYRVTYVLRREHRQWVIVASHASLIL